MRTMFKGFAAAVIAVGFATAANAETKPGTPAPESTEQAKPVKDKVYCVQDVPTGSRLIRKDCRTRAEWLKEGFDPLDPK
ncbi:hypothetical protein [Sphingomonas sp. MS122]|uniref:hypothetical protein n=1 Tax=Sphingomonas sp. MS122 TaxID=3412683 RepID=UPI003C2B9E79